MAATQSTCPSPLPPPDSMPPDHERNFGFTQFALELNELTAELKRTLPSTDTRLRPDQRSVPGRPPQELLKMGTGQGPQLWGPPWLASALTDARIIRYLEEGNIQAAEAQKRRIEQLQRDRRRVMEENNIVHQARFFRCFSPARPPVRPSASPCSPGPPAAPPAPHYPLRL